MAFGIDDAIGIASAASGLFGSDASEDAADQIGAANAEVQRMIREQQGKNDSAFKPYSTVGGLANKRLAQMLGLDIYGDGGMSQKFGKSDFIIVDDAGNFTMNRDLAALSPEYRKAYDEFVRRHNAKYGTSANISKGSHENVAERFIASQFDLGDLNKKMRAEARAFRSDPSFGSLLRKFSQDDLENDVVYNTGLQFGLDEGNKALERRAAAYGGYDSGATLKALTRYANDYGTTKAEGAYNRFMDDKNTTYGFLSGQQGVGLSATDRNQGLNTSLVNTAVGANMNAAGAQAQYGMEGAAALNNSVVGGIGNWLYNRRANSGGGSTGGTPPYVPSYGSSTAPAWWA